MLTKIVRAVKDYDPSKKVVASGYSDYERINSISPMLLPEIGAKAGVDVVMMDTGVKDGRTTFEFMTEEEVTEFVRLANENGLDSAIAGAIKFENLPAIKRIQPDIIGIRGMVCGGDRSTTIKEELVVKLKNEM